MADVSVNGMVAPHGGRLVDRILRGGALEEARRRASSLKRIALNARTMSDLELLAGGAYSPLEGFMGKADYRSVLDDMRLANGLPWTLPITLAVRRSAADALRDGDEVSLVSPWEEPLGILHLEERFLYDGREEARLVYGTEDPRHPGAAYQLTRGDVCLAGKVDLIARPPLKEFEPYRLDPAEMRARFHELGWRTVVGFQSQHPIHRAHEYIQKCALEPLDGLLIHPLVGKSKLDEIPSEVRIRCYKILVEQYYPDKRVVLGVFPGAMRYAGPRETLFHALVRKNYGCSHFIVGREYAGIETASAPVTVDEIFHRFTPEELGILPLFFDETFYCRRCETVTSPKTCPHSPADRMALSGALVREFLGRGEPLPSEFARPEVAEILRDWVRGAEVKTAPPPEVKETKAQKIERLKGELNPWEAYSEIVRFAREGFQSIPPAWLQTYFRFWGVYTQGDGVGAVGGKGGEGKAVPYLMLRIRIPNGILYSHQLRTIADLSEKYARGIADLTVRQNVQLHWIRIEHLPEIFQSLWRCGLATLGSCGDTTRNLTGCAVAGVDGDEIVDASPLVLAANRLLNGNPEFYNLPRKYKISITGCRAWCSYPEINDVGMTAVRHPETGEVGFSVRVGGGLSTDPHLAVGRALPGGAGAPHRLPPGARGGRQSPRRRVPRPRGHPCPEAGRLRLRGPRRPSWEDESRRHAGCRRARRPLRDGRAPHDQHAEPPHPERRPGPDRRAGEGDRGGWAEARWLALLARHHRLHRHRVLQARADRDKGLRALDGGGSRDTAPRLRPARQDQHHGLPE